MILILRPFVSVENQGLETLQRLKLCHKDLSPENLMILNSRTELNNIGNYIVNNKRSLVIDFGMCLRIPYSEDGMTYSEHGQQMHLITRRHPCGKPVSGDYLFDRNGLDFIIVRVS